MPSRRDFVKAAGAALALAPLAGFAARDAAPQLTAEQQAWVDDLSRKLEACIRRRLFESEDLMLADLRSKTEELCRGHARDWLVEKRADGVWTVGVQHIGPVNPVFSFLEFNVVALKADT